MPNSSKMKNIFITGCGDGLGKSLIEVGKNFNVNIFPHFKTNNRENEIFGDINEDVFLEKLSPFLEKNDIDVFINNAAIYKNDDLINLDDEDIKMLITTNLTSQILITKRVFKYFKKKNGGLIININSLSGKYPSAKESVYSASKSGLFAFSKSLQLEAIGSNIEIVDIFLGGMKTKMTKNRNNYDSLLDTRDVSRNIYDLILNANGTFINEIVIRKKN